MTVGWSVSEANAALDALLTAHRWIKLHVGDPGANGTANAAGNTSRQQATWTNASGGAATNSLALTWSDVSTTEDYTHWSAWSASSGGAFGLSGLCTANGVTAGDDLVVDIGDLAASMSVAA